MVSDGPERGKTVVVYLVCVCEKGTAMGGVLSMCASACIRSSLLCLPWGCIHRRCTRRTPFSVIAFLMCLALTPAPTFFASVWQRQAAFPHTFRPHRSGTFPVVGAHG